MSEQTHTITFDHIRSGQPRPYADSVYEFNMVFTANRGKDGWVDVWYPTKVMALKYAKAHQEFYEQPEWYQPKLEEFNEVEKGKWRVKIVQPYLD
jgi:hypothetical protein